MNDEQFKIFIKVLSRGFGLVAFSILGVICVILMPRFKLGNLVSVAIYMLPLLIWGFIISLRERELEKTSDGQMYHDVEDDACEDKGITDIEERS